MFPLAFVAGPLPGHWWGFISLNYVVWPTVFLMNVFIALKGTHFWFSFHLPPAFHQSLWHKLQENHGKNYNSYINSSTSPFILWLFFINPGKNNVLKKRQQIKELRDFNPRWEFENWNNFQLWLMTNLLPTLALSLFLSCLQPTTILNTHPHHPSSKFPPQLSLQVLAI